MAGCNMFVSLPRARRIFKETRAALFRTRAKKADDVPALAMITHREATEELATSRKHAADDEGERKEELSEEKLLEILLPLQVGGLCGHVRSAAAVPQPGLTYCGVPVPASTCRTS